jgi:hypothetical protein
LPDRAGDMLMSSPELHGRGGNDADAAIAKVDVEAGLRKGGGGEASGGACGGVLVTWSSGLNLWMMPEATCSQVVLTDPIWNGTPDAWWKPTVVGMLG